MENAFAKAFSQWDSQGMFPLSGGLEAKPPRSCALSTVWEAGKRPSFLSKKRPVFSKVPYFYNGFAEKQRPRL